MQELFDKAEALAGRPVEIQETRLGQFCVEWFNFNTNPPKPGKTEAEALENFIQFMETQLKENRDAINTDATGTAGEEDESLGSSR